MAEPQEKTEFKTDPFINDIKEWYKASSFSGRHLDSSEERDLVKIIRAKSVLCTNSKASPVGKASDDPVYSQKDSLENPQDEPDVGPNPCKMAAGLAICLFDLEHYTGDKSDRYFRLLDSCLEDLKVTVEQFFNALRETQSADALEAYLPGIAAYLTKENKKQFRCINFNPKNIDQFVLSRFFTEHPPILGDWLFNVRILRATLEKAIANFTKAREKKQNDPQKPFFDREFTAWICDWALAMQSTLASAKANLSANPKLTEEVGKVRGQLDGLPSPHQWIKLIMEPWLDWIPGKATLHTETPTRLDETQIAPQQNGGIASMKTGMQPNVKDILDKLPDPIAGALKICAAYVNHLIKAEKDLKAELDTAEKDLKDIRNQLKDQTDKYTDELNKSNVALEKIYCQLEENQRQKELMLKLQEENQKQIGVIKDLDSEIAEKNQSVKDLMNAKIDLAKDLEEKARLASIYKSSLEETKNNFSRAIDSRITEAKAGIRNRIASDFYAIDELFSASATHGSAGPSPQTWAIFAKKIREDLGLSE